MTLFFYICEYLQISPEEFFKEQVSDPRQIRKLKEKMELLNERQLHAVEIVIDTFLDSN